MKNKLYLIISLITLVVMALGMTFAYFSYTGFGNSNVDAKSTEFNLSLAVLGEYYGFPILPTNDEDIEIAYESKCKDKYNNGACQSYTIDIENLGNVSQTIDVTLSMNLVGLSNLSYMVLDSNNNVIVDKSPVINDTNMVIDNDLTLNNSENTSYKLIIWLTNLKDVPQDEEQNGTFIGNVTITSIKGDKLSGSININYNDGE